MTDSKFGDASEDDSVQQSVPLCRVPSGQLEILKSIIGSGMNNALDPGHLWPIATPILQIACDVDSHRLMATQGQLREHQTTGV